MAERSGDFRVHQIPCGVGVLISLGLSTFTAFGNSIEERMLLSPACVSVHSQNQALNVFFWLSKSPRPVR
jgi:hypothetical protein